MVKSPRKEERMQYLALIYGDENGWQQLGPDDRNAVMEEYHTFSREGQEARVITGGSELSAQLDVARTLVRRAERRVVELHPQDDTVVRYLNRLSDAVYAMARRADVDNPELFEGRA